LLFVWLSASALVAAEPKFPPLSGRVVDGAGLLDAAAVARLDAQLAGFERASSIQLVIATLPDLQGYEIEEFGYQLGRFWGIGQKDRNNGVLLIVAQAERKVRIEAGYGLEGTLTDALSAAIIQNAIVPRFKSGQFEAGIEEGVAAIMAALQGEYQPPPSKDESRLPDALPLLLLMIFVGVMFAGSFGGPRGGSGFRRGGFLPGGGFGGYSGGGFGGGGFSGGGGSFGGGGASGGW
jgi:uncharacterized protein